MTKFPDQAAFEAIKSGFDPDPNRARSLRKEAYVNTDWFEVDRSAVLAKSWQWVCHVEKLRNPGAYVATEIAGQPIAIVRDRAGVLRAFYNVCKHRAHELLSGEGETTRIMCPYHAWVYKLDGQLVRAPETDHLEDFQTSDICLDEVQVAEFAGFVFVNLDPEAEPLSTQAGNLETEIRHWAPDIEKLTFGKRLTYDIKSNWKNVVDNFLECYHCPTAHKDFCDLVDMDTYKVTTYGIYSSHMAEAGQSPNSAYDVSNATIKTHAVWWLWPTTCLMRYPGRSSMIVLNIIPMGPDRTLETYDFFLETPEPDAMELDAMRYLDEVLQVEDINLVESVQRGMNTPAFIGKVTIRIKKGMPGHVANRLQAAVWREAVHMAVEGVASVEDIDKAMWAGPGLRWAAMGPTMLFNLGAGDGGLQAFCDHFRDTFNGWWDGLGQPYLDDAVIETLVSGVREEADGKSPKELSAQRDALIVAMQTSMKGMRDG